VRVAVIGAGAVGTRLARQLVSSDGATRVLLRDERADRVGAIVEALGSAAVPDREPYDAPADVDVAVLAGPPGTHAAPARAFLAARVPVVSVSDAMEDVRALLDLDLEARERGVPVVVGAGFGPGLSCVLARHGADGLDSVDEVHVARSGTGGPACARHRLAALGGVALDWRDGAWLRRAGGSGRELCWFPDPIGGRDCYRAALPDALLLVPAFPGVSRVTARVAASGWDRISGRVPVPRRPEAEGGPGGLRVEVRGRTGSSRDVVVLGAMDRPAVAAGAVAALTARLAAEGGLARSGVAGLAEQVEARPFLVELARRGVRAAAFEGG
jgi:saccharopine dehydrogenase-like NADP-dependent oxidoreductase